MSFKRTLRAALLAFASGAKDGSSGNVFISGGTPPAGMATPKKCYSDRMRLVFTVGLEGSGHHYVVRAFEHAYKKLPSAVRLNGCLLAAPYFLSRSMAESRSHYSEARAQARHDMQQLALDGQHANPPGIVATMQAKPKRAKECDLHMNSFPTFGGPDKVFQFLDLAMLAEIAEAEGIDLRLVYLKRSAKELIVADTIHRHFQNGLGDDGTTNQDQRFMEYMQILVTEISVMHSMFNELGPGFVICHNFDLIGKAEQASNIANFIAPNGTIIADVFTEVLTQTKTSRRKDRGDRLPEKADEVAARLQRKLDVLELSLCKA